jgi:hypothetical protein
MNTNKTGSPVSAVRTLRRLLVFAMLPGLISAAFAAAGGTPQASLTLLNSDAKYCYIHNNLWTLTKDVTANTVLNGTGNVTWTVSAIKSDGGTTFSVHGGLTILNSGTADATIGNIVVNLQRPNSPKQGSNAPYVSLAANVANATVGDAATSANIVAGASQENAATNVAWGVGNYAVAGATGTFTETPGKSGTLTFTDASANDAFAIDPAFVLAPGASVTLLYRATFDPSALVGVAPGTSLRVEALVSFGNVNSRGGSGAAAGDIDINGSGLLEADEAYVRTVPSRATMAGVPAAPDECNLSVSVLDAGPTTTGTVTTSNPVGFDAFPATIVADTSWQVSADVASGALGGSVCNEAALEGDACGGTLNVVVGYTPDEFVDSTDDAVDNPINIGHLPIYATYECAPAAAGAASACVLLSEPIEEIGDGDFCSFSQGGFGGRGAPYDLLAANFATVYPTGVEVGIPGAGGFSMKFTSAVAVQAYLPAGGTSGNLTADLINPASSSSGVFGGQVLALKLNIALSDAGATNTGFGDLYYCDAASSLHGQTVRQILAVAETALGGGALPGGYSYASLQSLCEKIVVSFDGKNDVNPTCGVATAWAKTYLSKAPCP